MGLNPKQRVIIRERGNGTEYTFFDRGQRRPVTINSGWKFNGDVLSPTFSPSILTTTPPNEAGDNYRSHSFIRCGKIQYLNDCTHEFAGKTIDLPPLEEWTDGWREYFEEEAKKSDEYR